MNLDAVNTIMVMSENCVYIFLISSINLMCNIILGGYQEGKRGSILYTFPYGKALFGYRIVQEVNTPYYMSLNTKTIIDRVLAGEPGRERGRFQQRADKFIAAFTSSANDFIYLRQV